MRLATIALASLTPGCAGQQEPDAAATAGATLDGSDIMGIFIGAGTDVGRFSLTIDDVELW